VLIYKVDFLKNRQALCNTHFMFRALGIVIILIALSNMLSGAFHSFENATIAVFDTVETAALAAQFQLKKANSI